MCNIGKITKKENTQGWGKFYCETSLVCLVWIQMLYPYNLQNIYSFGRIKPFKLISAILPTMASVFYLRTLATFAREATIVTPFMMQLNSSVKNAFVLAK